MTTGTGASNFLGTSYRFSSRMVWALGDSCHALRGLCSCGFVARCIWPTDAVVDGLNQFFHWSPSRGWRCRVAVVDLPVMQPLRCRLPRPMAPRIQRSPALTQTQGWPWLLSMEQPRQEELPQRQQQHPILPQRRPQPVRLPVMVRLPTQGAPHLRQPRPPPERHRRVISPRLRGERRLRRRRPRRARLRDMPQRRLAGRHHRPLLQRPEHLRVTLPRHPVVRLPLRRHPPQARLPAMPPRHPAERLHLQRLRRLVLLLRDTLLQRRHRAEQHLRQQPRPQPCHPERLQGGQLLLVRPRWRRHP